MEARREGRGLGGWMVFGDERRSDEATERRSDEGEEGDAEGFFSRSGGHR